MPRTTAACYPKDHTERVQSGPLVSSPCSNGVLAGQSLPFTLDTAANMGPDGVFELEGQSDPAACEVEMTSLFSKASCDHEPCSFNGVYMPPIDKSQLMGFSGFYYSVLNTEKLFGQKVRADYALFAQLTEQLCSMTYAELQSLNSQSGANLPKAFLTNQCFTNVYMRQLLNNYGIQSFDRLKITDKVSKLAGVGRERTGAC